MPDDLARRVRFDFIRYANCWEDAQLLFEALQPAGKRILSIASGGDNCLALVGEGAEVVAADLSRAQLACVDLKIAAIRELDYDDLLTFLGIRSATDRLAVFERRLRAALPEYAAEFWAERPNALAAGIVHAGKFEAYFRLFRTRVLPLIHGRRTVENLLLARDPGGRRDFYERRWNNRRWRLVFRLFFSRWVMGRFGRDPEFFRYVEGSVADRILARAEHALTTLPIHENPYLEYILTGNFARALPPYLEPARLARIRENLNRITLFEGPVEEAVGNFDGFNLSDIFEYLPPEAGEAVYGKLLEKARPGARLAYWNMLVPRSCPERFRSRVESLDELASRLFELDRAFFYRRFVVEETWG
ncbi:MAG: BtaA family protein [Verrucomicrobia bacterium]|nr:BtaA family protein [Verrucomicrobiota bacterium]